MRGGRATAPAGFHGRLARREKNATFAAQARRMFA